VVAFSVIVTNVPVKVTLPVLVKFIICPAVDPLVAVVRFPEIVQLPVVIFNVVFLLEELPPIASEPNVHEPALILN
jgi:hypothetical protein